MDETITHLFYDYVSVKPIWNEDLFNWFMKQGLPAIGSKEVIILNNSWDLVLDKLIIIFKNYIYVIRCKKWNCHFHVVLSHINYCYKLETNVAVSQNKLDKHNILWSGLGEYLKKS